MLRPHRDFRPGFSMEKPTDHLMTKYENVNSTTPCLGCCGIHQLSLIIGVVKAKWTNSVKWFYSCLQVYYMICIFTQDITRPSWESSVKSGCMGYMSMSYTAVFVFMTSTPAGPSSRSHVWAHRLNVVSSGDLLSRRRLIKAPQLPDRWIVTTWPTRGAPPTPTTENITNWPSATHTLWFVASKCSWSKNPVVVHEPSNFVCVGRKSNLDVLVE